MALVSCPDCGHQCSPQAIACTDCGRPIVGSVTPPAVESRMPFARAAKYGTSTGTVWLVLISAIVGGFGILGELGGKAGFGSYALACLFAIWARITQAGAQHRAQVDAQNNHG